MTRYFVEIVRESTMNGLPTTKITTTEFASLEQAQIYARTSREVFAKVSVRKIVFDRDGRVEATEMVA